MCQISTLAEFVENKSVHDKVFDIVDSTNIK